MATHQALSGVTDEAFLQRMVRTHAERYGESFWDFFTTHVAPRLPPRPAIVDLGCGPGLFVQALSERYPQATLYGYDVTPAMIAYGQHLLLHEADFAVLRCGQLRPTHRMFVAIPTGS